MKASTNVSKRVNPTLTLLRRVEEGKTSGAGRAALLACTVAVYAQRADQVEKGKPKRDDTPGGNETDVPAHGESYGFLRSSGCPFLPEV